MQRVFTQDVGKRFRRGRIEDYSRYTWEQIARSESLPLDAITRPVVDAAHRAVSLDPPAGESAPPARGRPRGKE